MTTHTEDITTIPDVDLARVQLRTPKPVWDGMKIQAIREDMTAEQLATKAFEAYLTSVDAK